VKAYGIELLYNKMELALAIKDIMKIQLGQLMIKKDSVSLVISHV